MRLKKKLHSIFTLINNIISIENDYVTSGSHIFTTSSVDPTYTGLGRPHLNVATDEITQLYGIYRSWKDVALYLGISVRSLEQRQNEFNLTVSSRMVKHDTHTNINDE